MAKTASKEPANSEGKQDFAPESVVYAIGLSASFGEGYVGHRTLPAPFDQDGAMGWYHWLAHVGLRCDEEIEARPDWCWDACIPYDLPPLIVDAVAVPPGTQGRPVLPIGPELTEIIVQALKQIGSPDHSQETP